MYQFRSPLLYRRHIWRDTSRRVGSFFAGSYIIFHFGVIPSFCVFAVGGCLRPASTYRSQHSSWNTKYMIITTWQKHQRLPLSNEPIIINKQPIKHVSHIKFLGVIVDENLFWSYHIKEITSKIAKSTYQLARIQNFVDDRCRKIFYHAHMNNKLEYVILLFGGAAGHQLRPLKSLQKRAVKLIEKISSNDAFNKNMYSSSSVLGCFSEIITDNEVNS